MLGIIMVVVSFMVFWGGVCWLIVSLIRKASVMHSLGVMAVAPVMFVVGLALLPEEELESVSKTTAMAVRTPVIFVRTPTPKPEGTPTPWVRSTPTAKANLPLGLISATPDTGSTVPVEKAPNKKGTPTADESLREFVFCERLKAHMFQTWGQTSQVIHSGDPRVTGEIEPGDYVRVLTPEPNSDGAIRLQVFPHDNRSVGKTDNKVWIDWMFVAQFGTERAMFKCEDKTETLPSLPTGAAPGEPVLTFRNTSYSWQAQPQTTIRVLTISVDVEIMSSGADVVILRDSSGFSRQLNGSSVTTFYQTRRLYNVGVTPPSGPLSVIFIVESKNLYGITTDTQVKNFFNIPSPP